ncbi:DUF4956 domain-containing protein [Verrucomicrobiota bacterium]
MEDMLMSFGPTLALGWKQILCALLMSFVLTSALAIVYRWTFQGLSYSRGFMHTLILGGMIVSMMIMAIGNNLARGLGILGTLAIIRFRTPVRDSRDMIFLFVCLGTGIACGAGVYSVAIIGTITISAAALFLHWSPFTSRREYEGLLRFILPVSSTSEEDIKTAMKHCCSSFYMIGMREAAQGDAIEHSYQIRLIDPSYQSDLIKKLKEINGVSSPNLLMHRTTVEL